MLRISIEGADVARTDTDGGIEYIKSGLVPSHICKCQRPSQGTNVDITAQCCPGGVVSLERSTIYPMQPDHGMCKSSWYGPWFESDWCGSESLDSEMDGT